MSNRLGPVPGLLLADVYAGEVAGPVAPSVVHAADCDRVRCRCFGMSAQVHEAYPGMLVLRLLEFGEVVGAARLLEASSGLVLVSAATYRAAATEEDWAHHHQVVTEMLLRESVRVADERGVALATSLAEPSALLGELGFARAGTLMLRPRKGATPVCGAPDHDYSTSCRGSRGA